MVRNRQRYFLLALCIGALSGCGKKLDPDKNNVELEGYWRGSYQLVDRTLPGTDDSDPSKVELYFGKDNKFKLTAATLGKQVEGEYFKFSDIGTLTLDYKNAEVPEFGLVGNETEDYEYHIQSNQLMLRSETSYYTLRKRDDGETPVIGMDGHWVCKDKNQFEWRFYVYGTKFRGSVIKDKASTIYLEGTVNYMGDQLGGDYKKTDVAVFQLTEAEPLRPFEQIRAYLSQVNTTSRLKLVVLNDNGTEKTGSNSTMQCKQ